MAPKIARSLALPLCSLALLGCARSELEVDPGAASTSSTTTSTTTTSTPELPPPPPPCRVVSFDACRPWSQPTVVSRADEQTLEPDVAYQGRLHLVVYEVIDDESTSMVAAVDDRGQVRWREAVGSDTSRARIAWNPAVRRGLVGTDRGVRWLGEDGLPLGTVSGGSAYGSVAMNIDVAAVPGGFGAIVSPTSDPGGIDDALFASLPAEPPTDGGIAWSPFYDHPANPSIEHSDGVDGLVHRFGFEANVDGSADMWLVVFGWSGNMPQGPTTPPYDLGSSTTFTDGMVTDGPTTYFLKSGSSVLAFIEVDEGGDEHVHSLLLDSTAPSSPHVERLGTEQALDAMVVADRRLLEGSMAVARFDPDSDTLSDAIALGPEGSRPRLARTARGLAVTWTDSDTRQTLLNVLDCCLE